jgi:diguanylate cyclase (GGDEF)-like protein
VADVYDALTSRRVYKAAMTHTQARKLILAGRGSQFDAEVVDSFLRAEEKFIAVRMEYSGDGNLPAVSMPIPEIQQPERRHRDFCKILVVDDDPMQVRLLAKILSATGEPVFTAADGEEALAVLAEHGPRLVVSDWGMPKMDGVELCRRIRQQQGRDEPVHFIMLTASSDKERLLEAYDAGADDFVGKPCDTHELLARVRVGLRTTKLREELVEKTTASQAMSSQLATVNKRLERLSITDELTGLYNRRHAISRLEEQWELSARHGKAITVAMLDIDHFKKINDTHGHDAGDAVLRQVSEILRNEARGTDIVCRVGGEEFLVILPFQSPTEGRIGAERWRQAIARHNFVLPKGRTDLTVSIGLAGKTATIATTSDLLKAADLALYAAKTGGRNTIRIAESIEQPANPPPSLAPSPAPSPAPGQPSPDGAPLTPPAPAAEAVKGPVDLAAVLKRCGGDAQFTAMVIERFKTQAAQEVCWIDSALAGGDVERLHRAAHNLKSMAAYVSAETVSELARQIEELGRGNDLARIAPVLERLRQEVDRAIAWIAASNQAAPLQVA